MRFRQPERLAWPSEAEQRRDQRDALADQRDRRADQRDTLADEQQTRADLREQGQDEWERSLRDKERTVSQLYQRVRATIEQSRRLVAAAQECRDRRAAALVRSVDRAARDQFAVDQAIAESQRRVVRVLGRREKQRARTLRARSAASRQETASLLAAFAAVEEDIARACEDLAARRPIRAGELRRIAEDGRSTARRAREIARSADRTVTS
jgi:hypothetical protein